MLKFPSSSRDGLNIRGVGIPGPFVTVADAIVCRADEEKDLDTGLVGLEVFLVELDDERDRRCWREFRDLGRLC